MLIGLVFSCYKDDNNYPVYTPSETTLVGTWQLIQVLNDPGNGSGEFYDVDSDKTITFSDDSTVSSNGSLCQTSTSSDTPTEGTYSDLQYIIDSADCYVNEDIPISFGIHDTYLIFSYPCIEPCQAKFVKI